MAFFGIFKKQKPRQHDTGAVFKKSYLG